VQVAAATQGVLFQMKVEFSIALRHAPTYGVKEKFKKDLIRSSSATVVITHDVNTTLMETPLIMTLLIYRIATFLNRCRIILSLEHSDRVLIPHVEVDRGTADEGGKGSEGKDGDD
jgi:hypothetical protein